MRKVALLCAVLCGGLLASEQEKDMCGEASNDMFDALKNCAQRFEQAVDEFKGYLDSNVFKDANQTQPKTAQ
ncbi:MAG: hypothetical protein K2H55_02680 [Helicobacter sp.]|nr:hypothetical protein [Helicobacter sp.]MDE6044815.1 hypothetical protein [Helicobacter sp.]MDE7196826.1 hypothetical protein [Helicobacter sp.]